MTERRQKKRAAEKTLSSRYSRNSAYKSDKSIKYIFGGDNPRADCFPPTYCHDKSSTFPMGGVMNPTASRNTIIFNPGVANSDTRNRFEGNFPPHPNYSSPFPTSGVLGPTACQKKVAFNTSGPDIDATENHINFAKASSICRSPIHRKASVARTLSTVSSSSQSTYFSQEEKIVLLTVFQAAPLVFEDRNQEIKRVEKLDFTTERRELKAALSNTRIKVKLAFDFATTDRLSNFLIQRKGKVLHYSGHGHPDYLAIENGWGKMHRLAVDDLKQWIREGGNNLLLVFVSACHSRAAGDAFIEAGVKHVVCCQRNDQLIRNDAAIEFEKAFYQALANGHTLQEAFNSGYHKVVTSDQMEREVALEEAKNFILLPKKGNHNVRIFDVYQSVDNLQMVDQQNHVIENDLGIIPLPPDDFEGRQIEMYRVISALKNHRFLRLTGEMGIGKCSVARAVCKYIQERYHIFCKTISDIFWLECDDEHGDTDFSPLLKDGRDYSMNNREKLMRYLKENQTLLVIDARETRSISRLEEILKDIFNLTSNTRVILIESFKKAGILKRLPFNEREVHIQHLSFLETLFMFGKLCPHVEDGRCAQISNLKELRTLVVPDGDLGNELSTKIGREFFKMIGSGIPENIRIIAQSMTNYSYDRLVLLGEKLKMIQLQRKELKFYTRIELELKITEIEVQTKDAVVAEEFEQAADYNTILIELKELREKLPELQTLEVKARELRIKLKKLSDNQEFEEAAKVKSQLVNVDSLIQSEKLAKGNHTKLKRLNSHVSLKNRLNNLETKSDIALEQNNYNDLKKIQMQKEKIQGRLQEMPSREYLEDESMRLEKEHEEAKTAIREARYAPFQDLGRLFDVAQDIHRKLLETQRLLKEELKAQVQLDNISDVDKGSDSLSPGFTDKVETEEVVQKDEDLNQRPPLLKLEAVNTSTQKPPSQSMTQKPRKSASCVLGTRHKRKPFGGGSRIFKYPSKLTNSDAKIMNVSNLSCIAPKSQEQECTNDNSNENKRHQTEKSHPKEIHLVDTMVISSLSEIHQSKNASVSSSDYVLPAAGKKKESSAPNQKQEIGKICNDNSLHQSSYSFIEPLPLVDSNILAEESNPISKNTQVKKSVLEIVENSPGENTEHPFLHGDSGDSISSKDFSHQTKILQVSPLLQRSSEKSKSLPNEICIVHGCDDERKPKASKQRVSFDFERIAMSSRNLPAPKKPKDLSYSTIETVPIRVKEFSKRFQLQAPRPPQFEKGKVRKISLPFAPLSYRDSKATDNRTIGGKGTYRSLDERIINDETSGGKDAHKILEHCPNPAINIVEKKDIGVESLLSSSGISSVAYPGAYRVGGFTVEESQCHQLNSNAIEMDGSLGAFRAGGVKDEESQYDQLNSDALELDMPIAVGIVNENCDTQQNNISFELDLTLDTPIAVTCEGIAEENYLEERINAILSKKKIVTAVEVVPQTPLLRRIEKMFSKLFKCIRRNKKEKGKREKKS